MEVRTYVNAPVNRGMDEVRGSPKILPLVGVSFLLVCIIQSALNIYFWQQQVGLSKVFNVSECNATLLSENNIIEHVVKENYVEEINKLKQDKAKLSKENNQLKQDKNNLVEKNNKLNSKVIQEKNKQLKNEQNFKNEKNQLIQEKNLLQDNNNKLNEIHKVNQQNEEKIKQLTEGYRKLRDQISTAALPHLPLPPECPPVIPQVCPPVIPKVCPPVIPKVCPPVISPVCPPVIPPECPPVIPPECPPATPPVCPPGWHTLKGSCYWVSCAQSTWFDARTRCLSDDADLVIVNDETELSFLSGLVGTGSTWVGLNVHHTIYTQTLVWVDGNKVTQGSNDHFYYGTSEDSCVYMRSSLYYPSSCNQNLGWICEKKLEKSPTCVHK